MTQEGLQRRFRTAMARQQVLTEEGLKAARIVFRQAGREGIECALAGGIAMHVFGYIRATKNVDLLASRPLSLQSERQLSFGGDRHPVQVGEKTIPVNVIVRNDVFQVLYEAALCDAKLLEQVLGKTAGQATLPGLERYYVQAEVMRAGDKNGRQE